ncbi:MAG: hydroxyacylglutathione hydrolase [Gammaproteobacteria bacterium]
MLRVTPVRAFRDNYIWLIHGRRSDCVAVVDPGDASPVEAAVAEAGLTIEAILITHHHPDHAGGIGRLTADRQVPVFGPAQERIAGVTRRVAGGDRVEIPALDLGFEVLDVPGHTAGHIAYYGHGALFCGDTLFSAGCGRLFEGTPEQMLASLERLAALPGDTRVYCAHEYTLANLAFAQAVEPANRALADYAEEARRLRRAYQPTLPSTLALEREVNPFLRWDEPAVRAAAESRSPGASESAVGVFAAIRRWKDQF